MDAFQLVKNTFEEIAAEDAAILEAQLNEYRNWIDTNATEIQKESYDKAVGYGWNLESANNEFIKLTLGQSTMKLYPDGRVRRTKPTRGEL